MVNYLVEAIDMRARRFSNTVTGNLSVRIGARAVTAALALAAVGALGPAAAHAGVVPDPPGPAAGGPAAAALAAGSYSGTFANVADAPAGTAAITGTAKMVISAAGTKVSLAATGLDPKAVYVAHVHNQPCATAEGGTHFQFDPKGPMAPPNEIWLTPVAVTPKGAGSASASSTMKANSSAKSVVIHLKRPAGAATDEAKPPKLACADLAHK
ncbi:MAG TPA: hypothetical protein VHU88_09165 [Sporichthyaceae bacterium]|nr:hypothetical protein [Sporichthyaceae bacterium]